jgi:hypothetical protein
MAYVCQVILYSLSPPPPAGGHSPIRRTYETTAEAFVDLSAMTDVEAATRIRRDGVHVLVDLMGYTRRSRNEILALRPSPIQVRLMQLRRQHMSRWCDGCVKTLTPSLRLRLTQNRANFALTRVASH